MEEGAREHVRDKSGSFEDLVCPHTVASGKEEAEEVCRWRAWMERQARGAPGWTERPVCLLPLTQPSYRPGVWVLLCPPHFVDGGMGAGERSLFM